MKKRAIKLTDQPWAIAHRGDSDRYPENTRSAFRSALTAKVNAIELDVRLSSDDVPLICHDANLSRYGGSRQSIRNMTAKQVCAVDVGRWKSPKFSGETILTLSEVLKLCRDVVVCIELKATAGRGATSYHAKLVKAVIAVVQQERAQHRVRFLCFHAGVLRLCARFAPGILRVRNCERLPRDYVTWLKQQEGCAAVCFDRRLVTVNVVSAAQALGLLVYSYSANDKIAADHLLRCGVDGILSDRSAWLVSYLQKH
jgi:glycerophosphoryl diester phosphodiesterase